MSDTPAKRKKPQRRAARKESARPELTSPDYISYHSGSTKPVQEVEERAEPAAFALEKMAFTAFIAAPRDEFYIKFRTANLRPNHQITIRNNVDGWAAQGIYGGYYQGEWVFGLEKDRYPNGVTMKFCAGRSDLDDGKRSAAGR